MTDYNFAERSAALAKRPSDLRIFLTAGLDQFWSAASVSSFPLSGDTNQIDF